MEHNSEFFRPFPDYEEVFYDDIENHKKYFLPICSVNLKFMFPERDEWVHFISAKEMNVGHETIDCFTRYTKRFMYSFDINDSKYKFEGDWDYFHINHEDRTKKSIEIIKNFEVIKPSLKSYKEFAEWLDKQNYGKVLSNQLGSIYGYTIVPNDDEETKRQVEKAVQYYQSMNFDRIKNDYIIATNQYNVCKAFYKKYGHIPESFPGCRANTLELIEQNREKHFNKFPEAEPRLPEFFGLIEDIKAQSTEAKRRIEQHIESGFRLEDMRTPICYNIWELPLGSTAEYIGCISEQRFITHGATILNVFHDSTYNKATMLLDFD